MGAYSLSSGADEFQCLVSRPIVLRHEVRDDDHSAATDAVSTMDENGQPRPPLCLNESHLPSQPVSRGGGSRVFNGRPFVDAHRVTVPCFTKIEDCLSA